MPVLRHNCFGSGGLMWSACYSGLSSMCCLYLDHVLFVVFVFVCMMNESGVNVRCGVINCPVILYIIYLFVLHVISFMYYYSITVWAKNFNIERHVWNSKTKTKKLYTYSVYKYEKMRVADLNMYISLYKIFE